jgi:dTDP-4-dehydrorhamnose 3,5-epimerase
VLRGLHYQVQQPQVKFISCLKGHVIDFAVDIRQDSESFGQVIQYDLREEKAETLYLPKGIAHGFISLAKTSVLLYLVSGIYNKSLERGVNYKSLNLDLPIEPTLINSRDDNWPNFDQAEYY